MKSVSDSLACPHSSGREKCLVCRGSRGFQSSVGRDGKLGHQDVAEMAGNQTNAGASSIAWFVLKQPDELVQNVWFFFFPPVLASHVTHLLLHN